MRPSHNWLSYWLPLLLFAWAATALAAQTWTTVWTPDSASATKATTKDATHESKTNCYPCKEWEDYGGGKGRWVDLDEVLPAECPTPTSHARRQTAEADSLPDHLNPCKICKAGKVDNKDNGFECETRTDKPGKCCDGVCVEIPPEGTDPCAWASSNDDFRRQYPEQFHPVFGGEGYILCVFGETYPCVPPDNIPIAWQRAGITRCIQEHEQYHKDHSPIQCPPCGTGIGTYADKATEREEECCAFFETLKCLNDLLNTASDNHRDTIQKVLDDATDKMRFEPLICWGGIDSHNEQQERVQMPCN
ncbi:MAG: hypothetical protein RBS84_02330 [Kiritimatiellia bacterium]|jgi:hypothetical protein|nr:hypothetical protein [Kiritimatiellia bacterium]